MLSRDHSVRSDPWNLLGTSGTVFDSPRAVMPRHRLLIRECFTLGIKVLQAETQCEIVQGNLSLEVKKEIEGRYSNTENCKETVDHGFFLSSRRGISTRFTWLINQKLTDLGTSI